MEPEEFLIAKHEGTGLRVFLVKSKGDMFHVQFNTKAGLFSERKPKELEYAHFLEHLNAQFTSTTHPRQGEVIELIESMGLEWNAFTTDRFTGYFAKGISENRNENKDLLATLDIMLDSFFRFKIDETIFRQEIHAVNQELDGYRSDGANTLREEHQGRMFPNHPLAVHLDERIDNLQTQEKNISLFRENILRFRKELYGPGNSLLCLSVPLSKNQTLRNDFWPVLQRRLDAYTKDVGVQNPIASDRFPMLKLPSKRLNITMSTVASPKGMRSIILLSIRLPKIKYTDWKQRVAISFFAHVLTSGFSSRLIKELRTEKGLIYSAYAYGSFDRFDSNLNTFNIQTSCDHKNVHLANELIVQELMELGGTDNNKALSESDFRKFQKKQALDFEKVKTNVDGSDWIDVYGTDILFQEPSTMMPIKKITPTIPHTFTEMQREIESLTLEESKQIYRDIFDRDQEMFITYNTPIVEEAAQKKIIVLYTTFLNKLKTTN